MSETTRALTFGQVADEYDRWRPGYPEAAVAWLAPAAPARVADVGAGTGKMTSLLVARGLAVEAVEPDARMLAVLARNNATARLAGGSDQYDRSTKGSADAVRSRLSYFPDEELAFAQFDWAWETTPDHHAAHLATTSMAIAMSDRERADYLSEARSKLQTVCDAARRESMPIRYEASCARWTPKS